MSRRALAGLLLGAVCVAPALAEDPAPPVRRGPLPGREEWLPAQALLTLPALSPDPLPRGHGELRIDLDWGSDFGWEAGPGGRAQGLLYMFDGEHRSATLSARRAVSRTVTVGVHVPVRWRGAGILDDVIDPFHRIFGFPDSGRPLFAADQLRVEAQREGGGAVPVRLPGGTGLGAAEVEALWSLRRRGLADRGTALAVVGRVLLPTGRGPFARHTVDGGAQLAASHTLGGACDLYSGLGLTWFGDAETGGFSHPRTRPHAFLAFEWRPFRRTSLLAQADAARRLITGVSHLPGGHSYLRLGVRTDIGKRFTLDAGFTEGLHSQETTTDFGVQAGVSRRF